MVREVTVGGVSIVRTVAQAVNSHTSVNCRVQMPGVCLELNAVAGVKLWSVFQSCLVIEH